MGKTFLLVLLGALSLYALSHYLSPDKKIAVKSATSGSRSLVVTKAVATTTTLLPIGKVGPSAASSSDALLGSSATSSLRIVTHVKTPSVVKAFYMTSWVAGTKDFKNRLITSADNTKNINAFVIDVKDNTGVISWEGRVKKEDLALLIDELHGKGYYLIGRVTVFQDPLYAKEFPQHSVKKADGTLWKSKKNEPWVDPGSKDFWKYIEGIGKDAHALGFDEINLDYIRYSTDGLNEKLIYPESKERGNDISKGGRKEVISEFYTYITDAFHKEGIPVSGDLFGIITTSSTDIPVLGQDLGVALSHFDYVAPMIYPSHYAPGTFGYQNPSAHPGPVITESLLGALKIADSVASSTGQATSTLRAKIRPWYQDFNLGAVYTATMVKAQIDAGNKLGVTSYMMWDPNNKYTLGAYK